MGIRTRSSMINNPPLEKEALEVLEEDEDVMDIPPPANFIPRKRRTRKMKEQLDGIFLRRSKRLSGKHGGFKNEDNPKEAAKEVEGSAKGFLQIHPEGNSGNTVCELCGHVGYGHLLVCCVDCKGSTTHQYCLEEVVYDKRLVEFVCYECHQRHEELKNVPLEKEPGHAHSGPTMHQLNTQPLESAIDVVEWRNREGRFGKYYSRKKGSKKKPTMQPVDSNLTNRKIETTSNDPRGFTTNCLEKSLPGHQEGSNPATWK